MIAVIIEYSNRKIYNLKNNQYMYYSTLRMNIQFVETIKYYNISKKLFSTYLFRLGCQVIPYNPK